MKDLFTKVLQSFREVREKRRNAQDATVPPINGGVGKPPKRRPKPDKTRLPEDVEIQLEQATTPEKVWTLGKKHFGTWKLRNIGTKKLGDVKRKFRKKFLDSSRITPTATTAAMSVPVVTEAHPGVTPAHGCSSSSTPVARALHTEPSTKGAVLPDSERLERFMRDAQEWQKTTTRMDKS